MKTQLIGLPQTGQRPWLEICVNTTNRSAADWSEAMSRLETCVKTELIGLLQIGQRPCLDTCVKT